MEDLKIAIKEFVNAMDEEIANTVREKGIEWVIQALREKQAREQPGLLSLEQLWEMEGKHIWFKNLSTGYEAHLLINKIHFNFSEGTCEFEFAEVRSTSHARDYGKTWLAYAHRPAIRDCLGGDICKQR